MQKKIAALLLLTCSAPGWSSDMVLIPAGSFIYGSDRQDDQRRGEEFGSLKPWYSDEHPQHKVTLPAYYLDKYEVSNAEYRQFVIATDHPTSAFWLETGYTFSTQAETLEAAPEAIIRKLAVGVLHLDMDTRRMDRAQLLEAIKQHYQKFGKLAVNHVTWHDANAYCAWAGKRLPTEAEWEKAARGTTGQEYPWGNTWQDSMNIAAESEWPYGVAPPGSYPQDKSPYGIFDMAGNVSEWVQNWYQPYPGNQYKSVLFGKNYKVARGGGWSTSGHYALQHYRRGAYRINLSPEKNFNDVGFRCAKSIIK